MQASVIGVYEAAITVGTIAGMLPIFLASVYLYMTEDNEIEYMMKFSYVLSLFVITSLSGAVMLNVFSPLPQQSVLFPFLTVIYVLNALIIPMTGIFLVSQDLRQTGFYGAFGTSTIGFTITTVILFNSGERTLALLALTPDLFGLNGGIGFLSLVTSIGILSFTLYLQTQPYFEEAFSISRTTDTFGTYLRELLDKTSQETQSGAFKNKGETNSESEQTEKNTQDENES